MLKQNFSRFQTLIEQGKTLEAIDEWYAEEIIQIENTDEPIQGKDVLRQYEAANLEGVNSLNIKVVSVVIDTGKGLVAGELDIVFDSKKRGPQRLREAFVQRWQNDQIIHQRFYYKGFEPV
ncbi:hypothetical protein [Runella sp.]|uniref:hypothetical protein n=1 Tax=Runella sp. TaxID=1960881 RepID=UPI003D0B38C8